MNVLLLVPTALELDRLHLPASTRERAAICGFGPIAAAARTAESLARGRYDAAILLGIAGTYDEAATPIGAAVWCDEVRLDGVGAGEGSDFLSADRLGFPQYANDEGVAIGTTLPLTRPLSEKRAVRALTVCAASGDARHAAQRRAAYPGAVVEEMEGFGVATAATLAGVRVSMLRGVSNVAGDRRVAAWKIDDALAAVREELIAFLSTIDREAGS